MRQEPTGRTDVAIAWAALLVLDAHRCGMCRHCPADGPEHCRQYQAALLDVATLGQPHPQH
ncbi:MAG TPA: hypothetical protein VF082_12735 [Jiangellaceae bacterium]